MKKRERAGQGSAPAGTAFSARKPLAGLGCVRVVFVTATVLQGQRALGQTRAQGYACFITRYTCMYTPLSRSKKVGFAPETPGPYRLSLCQRVRQTSYVCKGVAGFLARVRGNTKQKAAEEDGPLRASSR